MCHDGGCFGLGAERCPDTVACLKCVSESAETYMTGGTGQKNRRIGRHFQPSCESLLNRKDFEETHLIQILSIGKKHADFHKKMNKGHNNFFVRLARVLPLDPPCGQG